MKNCSTHFYGVRFARRDRKEPDRMPFLYKASAALLTCFVVHPSIPARALAGQGRGTPATAQSPPAGPREEYAPLTAEELDALVAPIALYPDALVAQVLGASTFPYEIVAATLWMKDNSSLTGEALAKA